MYDGVKSGMLSQVDVVLATATNFGEKDVRRLDERPQPLIDCTTNQGFCRIRTETAVGTHCPAIQPRTPTVFFVNLTCSPRHNGQTRKRSSDPLEGLAKSSASSKQASCTGTSRMSKASAHTGHFKQCPHCPMHKTTMLGDLVSGGTQSKH